MLVTVVGTLEATTPSGPGADVEYIIWTRWCQGSSDPLEKSVITGLEGAREVGR